MENKSSQEAIQEPNKVRRLEWTRKHLNGSMRWTGEKKIRNHRTKSGKDHGDRTEKAGGVG